MTLKPLYTEGNKPETVIEADITRAEFLGKVSAYLAGPCNPELTDEQKQKVIDKIKWLLENEFRPTYWQSVAVQLNPRVIDGVTQLMPKLLLWAEYRKQPVYKHKEGQSIPHAKNGKIIRSAKGLS